MTVYNQREEYMSDDAVISSKTTIADKIHEAVSSLLVTEVRLNGELKEARRAIERYEYEIRDLQTRLETEQKARRHLTDIISKVAELVQPQ
jgi:predicted RNase H-like nuclease (RuvC/YqgF family)